MLSSRLPRKGFLARLLVGISALGAGLFAFSGTATAAVRRATPGRRHETATPQVRGITVRSAPRAVPQQEDFPTGR